MFHIKLSAAASATAAALAVPAFAPAQGTPTPLALESAPQSSRAIVKSDQTWTLVPNSVRTFTMRMRTLTDRENVEQPCGGFDVSGHGIDYAASDLDYYGFSRGRSEFDAGVDPARLGYEARPDGSLWKPETAIRLPGGSEAAGRSCQARGWDFAADADPELRRLRTSGTDARIARRRGKRSASRRSAPQPIQVLFAGRRVNTDHTFDIVVRIATGDLPGPTTLSMHARMAQEHVQHLPETGATSGA